MSERSSSEEQAKNVAAGKVHDALLPEPLTIDQWRALVEPWMHRSRMALYDITVGQLHQLVERCARAEKRVAECQRWAMNTPHVDAGDALRKVLYPMPHSAKQSETCVFCERAVQPYVECVCAT